MKMTISGFLSSCSEETVTGGRTVGELEFFAVSCDLGLSSSPENAPAAA